MNHRESERVRSFGTTVFAEFSRLAAEHKAVNLGQGFPDFDGPDVLKEAVAEAIKSGFNQYAVSQGVPALRQAIAAHALRFYGQAINPDTEVAVTSGATEAIFDAILGLTDPGDEVVVFEPFYDSYLASLQIAGAVPKWVRLQPPDAGHRTWWFDSRELESAFTEKTALVILNTPHNPTGKVFTRAELEEIGALAKRFDAVVLSDEVYEHLVFAPAVHLRPSTLDVFRDRTLTISSGGKSFSFTGWKIGWVLGPAPLVKATQKMHQWVTFASATPFQHAIARALALPDTYFAGFIEDYHHKRWLLSAALEQAGLPVHLTEGSYFLMADISKRGFPDDVAFCRDLTSRVGVCAIPPSAFYSAEHHHHARHLARFAFCKTDAVLEEAARRLTEKTRL